MRRHTFMLRLLVVAALGLAAACESEATGEGEPGSGPSAEDGKGGLCVAIGRDGQTAFFDEPLRAEQLEPCDPEALRLIRNTLFARHGYRFNSPVLGEHFAKFDWYQPNDEVTKELRAGRGFTAADEVNLPLIKKIEKAAKQRAKRQAAQPGKGGSKTPKQDGPETRAPEKRTEAAAPGGPAELRGKRWNHVVASSDEYYEFCADGSATVEYTVSEHQDHQRSGTWKKQGKQIILHWREESGAKGIGVPIHCAGSCEYESYAPFRERVDEVETINFSELEAGGSAGWTLVGAAQGC